MEKQRHIPKQKDARVKLTDEQRREIKENPLGLSKRQLALKFKVSRRLVDFIMNPDREEQNLLLREIRGGWKQYYDKKKHNESMKNYRKKLDSLGIKLRYNKSKENSTNDG